MTKSGYIKVKINTGSYHAWKWCRDNFGPSKPTDTTKYSEMPWFHYRTSSTFYFKDPEHATMFKLRWN